MEKNNICCCGRDSCSDLSTISELGNTTSSKPELQNTNQEPKSSSSKATSYLTDPLFVRMVEYNVLKKRVQQIESKNNY